MTIGPGVVLGGDFRIVSRLSKGGMGAVWIAEQESVGRKRAVKVMRADLATNPRLRERFVHEAKVGATINSEHVVDVVAAGIDDALGVPWLAMELLEGSDLAAVIHGRGALSHAEAAEVVDQLGHALAAAHAVGVVHRDLKPENIFLARPRRRGGPPFDVKVLDFGIAKVVAEAQASAQTSEPLGTPLYMAPEQTETVMTPTPAIDVWALGLIAYRMLTGRYFWRSARDGAAPLTALFREVLIDPLPSATARAAEDGLAARLPPGFDAWLAGCLAREPSERHADVGSACSELAAALRATAPVRAATLVSGSMPPPPLPPQRPQTPQTPRSVPPRPSSAPLVTPVHGDSAFKLGRVEDIVVIRWRSAPTLASVAEMDRALTRAMRDLGSGTCAVMPIIGEDVPSPDGPTRAALSVSVEKHDRSIHSVAYVVEGTGFHSAAQRSIITGLSFVARPRHPTKVFDSIGQAVAWLATRRPAATSTSGELVAAIQAFVAA